MLSTFRSRLQVSALIFTRQLRTLRASTSILPAEPSQAAPDLRKRGYWRRCQISHPCSIWLQNRSIRSHLDFKQGSPNYPLHTKVLLPFPRFSRLCRNLEFRVGSQRSTIPVCLTQIQVYHGPQVQHWSYLLSYLAQWLLAHLLTCPSQTWL